MIYTSYFAKLNKLPDTCCPISICAEAPVWYSGKQYKKLAPKYDFFMRYKLDFDENAYIKAFNEQVLDVLDVETVLAELDALNIENKEDIVLLCYEKSDDFCHRHIVANWLQNEGIPCAEYQFKN